MSVSKTVGQGALGFKWKEKLLRGKCGFKVPPAHMADTNKDVKNQKRLDFTLSAIHGAADACGRGGGGGGGGARGCVCEKVVVGVLFLLCQPRDTLQKDLLLINISFDVTRRGVGVGWGRGYADQRTAPRCDAWG